MPRGIHVEVSVGDPDTCPVAPKSRGGKRITSINSCAHPDQDGSVIQEFTITKGTERITPDAEGHPTDDSRRVFDNGSKRIVRLTREESQSCVCACIERHGCPVREITAVDGTLNMTFVAPDQETLQIILEELTDRYDKVSLRRLLQSSEKGESNQLTTIDLDALTDRQNEVLLTAHRQGYFEYPKEASAADVAEELGIARSTFTEHLAAAQRNLLDELQD